MCNILGLKDIFDNLAISKFIRSLQTFSAGFVNERLVNLFMLLYNSGSKK